METFLADTSFLIRHLKLNSTPVLHFNTQSRKYSSYQLTLQMLSKVKKSLILQLYESFKLDFELFNYDPTDYIEAGKDD